MAILGFVDEFSSGGADMKHVLTVVGYVLATFLTQGLSHFLIFKAHYDAMTFMAPEPNFALGIASMLIQGTVLSLIYSWARPNLPVAELPGAILIALMFGAFLVSYIGLAEAAKYAVPSTAAWIGVETAVGAVQFVLIGLIMGLAHARAKAA